MTLTHAKVSAKVDGADSSLVRPSDWNAPHVGSALGVTMLTDYAGLDLTGATSSDAALSAAEAATALGGTIELPIGYIKFNTWVPSKRIQLKGQGYSNTVQDPFGHANWSNHAYYGGTVLISTATSGAAISSTITDNRLDLVDLMLIGPGSGTSTGVKLGTSSNFATQCTWRNVLIVNFALGADLQFVLDSSIEVRFRGCSTGLSLSHACNQNSFPVVEVQHWTVDGILFGVDAGGPNTFPMTLLQNGAGNAGIRTVDSASEFAVFDEIYMEAITCTYWIDFAAGTGHQVRSVHMSGAGGPIRMGASGGRLANLRTSSGTPALTLSGNYNEIEQPYNFVIDPATMGAGNWIKDRNGGRHELHGTDLRIDSGKKIFLETVGTASYVARNAGTGATEISAPSGAYIDIIGSPLRLPTYTTAGRPAASTSARMVIYDSTLGLPIFSDGTNWRNFAGTIV